MGFTAGGDSNSGMGIQGGCRLREGKGALHYISLLV